MFLIGVDAHSKWPEVVEMPQTTAQRTNMELRRLFAAYGLPQQIVTDNGPQFTAKEFSDFLRSNGVKNIRVSPYHPSSNGLAETFMKTFKGAMKAGSLPLPDRIANFLLTYQSTPHAMTSQAPSELFLGRHLHTRLHLCHPQCEEEVTDHQAVQKANHDRRTH